MIYKLYLYIHAIRNVALVAAVPTAFCPIQVYSPSSVLSKLFILNELLLKISVLLLLLILVLLKYHKTVDSLPLNTQSNIAISPLAITAFSGRRKTTGLPIVVKEGNLEFTDHLIIALYKEK